MPTSGECARVRSECLRTNFDPQPSARLARTFPGTPLAPRALDEISKSLTPAHIEAEVRYLKGPGRVSFERP